MTNSEQTTPLISEEKRFFRRSLLCSEQVYGFGFQTPGGVTLVKDMCSDLYSLKSKPGLSLLDVGCGTGGASKYFVEEFKAKVIGIDLSEDAIQTCKERFIEFGLTNTNFLCADAQDKSLFSVNQFDVVWACDVGVFVPDKSLMLKNINHWLKPNGLLLLIDHGTRSEAPPIELKEYCDHCGYHMVSLNDYKNLLLAEGYQVISAENNTSTFLDLSRNDISRILNKRDHFLKVFSEQELDHMKNRWEKKIRMAEEGSLRWHKIIARKSQTTN